MKNSMRVFRYSLSAQAVLMVGLGVGVIRQVRASLVASGYFEVTGCNPILGLDLDFSLDAMGGSWQRS